MYKRRLLQPVNAQEEIQKNKDYLRKNGEENHREENPHRCLVELAQLQSQFRQQK